MDIKNRRERDNRIKTLELTIKDISDKSIPHKNGLTTYKSNSGNFPLIQYYLRMYKELLQDRDYPEEG